MAENQKNSKGKIIAAFIPIVLVIVIAGVLLVANNKKKSPESTTTSSSATSSSESNADKHYMPNSPVVNNDDGGINVNKALGLSSSGSNMVNVNLYFDYMCPWCGTLERTYNSAFTKAMESGEANLTLHPVNFLDANSNGTEYSSRAANAAYQVAQDDPTHFWAFTTAMMSAKIQPEEGTSGLTDDEIANVALDAGVPKTVVAKFTVLNFKNYVSEYVYQKVVEDAGVRGTPTIMLNLDGKKKQEWKKWAEGIGDADKNGEAKSTAPSIKELNKILLEIRSGKKIS